MQYPVSDASANLHNGKFSDGDPALGILPSIDKAAWLNALYDEMIALIVAGGGTPSETTLTQVRDAVLALISTAIATRAPLSHGHTWAQISNIPATFPPSVHFHNFNDIQSRPATYPPSAHAHALTDLTGLASFCAYAGSAQGISAGVYTRIAFNSIAWNDLNGINGNGSFVAPATGEYNFIARVHGSNSVTQTSRQLDLFVNGGFNRRIGEDGITLLTNSIGGASGPMKLNQGDIVDVYYHTVDNDIISNYSMLTYFCGWRIR